MNNSVALTFADVLLWAREVAQLGIPADVGRFIAHLYYILVRPIVAVGGNHVIVVSSDVPRVFDRGTGPQPLNDNGHRSGVDGDGGHPIVRCFRDRIVPSERIIGAICSERFVMLWTCRGRYMWGENKWGELGIGHSDQRDRVEYVSTPWEIISAACGLNHVLTLCARDCGAACVVGWGRHIWRGGRIIGESNGVPALLPIEDACAVAATGIFSFILARGRVHLFSYNQSVDVLDYTGVTRIWTSPRAFTVVRGGLRFEALMGGRAWLEPRKFREVSSTEWPPIDGFVSDMISFCDRIPEVPGVVEGRHEGFGFAVVVTSRGVYKFFENHDCCYDAVCLYAV